MTTPPEPDEQAADARQTDTLHVDEVSADISDVYWIDAPVPDTAATSRVSRSSAAS